MPSEIALALANGIGVVGVVLAVGWMLATGSLATRPEMKRLEHDRDEWRAESRIKDQHIIELGDQLKEKDRQIGELREVGANVLAVMNAIQINRSGEGSHRNDSQESS